MTPRRRAALARLETRLARGAAVSVKGLQRHPGAPVLVAPSPARMRVGARQENTRGRDPDPLPAAIAEQLVAGHLSQRCEPCGITEAAGGSCTSCGRLTGPADWIRLSLSEMQIAARRARVHSTAENGATALETANPKPLGLWPA